MKLPQALVKPVYQIIRALDRLEDCRFEISVQRGKLNFFKKSVDSRNRVGVDSHQQKTTEPLASR